MSILALDASGQPRKWVSYETAIIYHAKEMVVWTLGDIVANFHGGYRKDGTRSSLSTTSIIAIKGHGYSINNHGVVSLTNKTLFGRDKHVCAYCGGHFPYSKLSRDHIVPVSKGGTDTWMNVVTACVRCNLKKSNKLLADTNMELLYIPYTPNHYERLILENRHILADQMEYLLAGVPKHSRLL